jgi:uracil-DNA glycosylase
MNPEWHHRYLDVMGVQRWVLRTTPEAPSPVADTPDPETAPVPRDQATGDDIALLDWDDLAARVAECTRCAELAASRTQTVFGVGDRQADWLFIGEAPGVEEDRRGEPFVGPAGQLLDSMLFALGLKRGQGVYIANILKCRPPGNRDPRPEESRACREYLDRQIGLIRPRVIVALGRVAAHSLLDTDEPLARLRGRTLDYRDTPLVVTYHPAYLLRNPADKRKAWEDLRLARRVTGV